MKTLNLVGLMILVSLGASSDKIQAQSNIEIVWGAVGSSQGKVGQVVKRKLTFSDGSRSEKIILATRIGVSQNGNTLTVISDSDKHIFEASFTSAGGCAIGNILGNRKQQIAIWDFMVKGEEAHTGSHYYRVVVYDWNAEGKLVEEKYYATQRKYAYSFQVIKPWQEFLKNKSQAINLTDLKIGPISKPDQQEMLRLGIKLMPQRTCVKKGRKIGPWACWFRYNPKDCLNGDYWNGEWEIWQKINGKWKNLITFGGPDSDEEMADSLRMPVSIWTRLWHHNGY